MKTTNEWANYIKENYDMLCELYNKIRTMNVE